MMGILVVNIRILFLCFFSLFLAGCNEPSEKLSPEAVERGKKLAYTCTACHSLTSNQNQVGPYLKGVLNRSPGMAEDYNYSESLSALELPWTPERIVSYVLNPFEMASSTKMPPVDISRDEAKDIVIYIQSLDQ